MNVFSELKSMAWRDFRLGPGALSFFHLTSVPVQIQLFAPSKLWVKLAMDMLLLLDQIP